MANLEELFDVTYTGPEIQAILDAAHDLLLDVYATKSWINNQGYATQAWVNGKGYLTSDDLQGYATQQWVNGKGYASESYVQQNYLPLTGGIITGTGDALKLSVGNLVLEDGNIDLHSGYVYAETGFKMLNGTNDHLLTANGGMVAKSDVGATTLGGLTDVVITTPSDGQVLKYDGTIGKWVNGAGGATSLATLSWSGYSSGSYDGTEAKSISIPNNTNQLTNGAGFITSVAFADLTSHPTTLSGYGITDAASSSALSDYLLLTGGTLTGNLTVGSNTDNKSLTVYGTEWITGNLTLKPYAAAYGSRLIFGDVSSQTSAPYVYIGEDADDVLTIYASSGINLNTSTGSYVKVNGVTIGNISFSDLTSHPTTLSGYGITDAKISGGTITLGSNTITPLTSVAFADLTSHPTTLSGYGITDAKISGGTITLGSNTITPLTSVAFADLTSHPTTLSGYGITDAASSSALSDYLPLTGGTLKGNLRLKDSGNYGMTLYFGDGSYCYLSEDTDDHLTINASKGVEITTGIQSGSQRYPVTINGNEVLTVLGGTLSGNLTIGSENVNKNLEVHGATHLDGTLVVEGTTSLSGLLYAENIIRSSDYFLANNYNFVQATYKGTATSSTSGTSKSATISGYSLSKGNLVVITFTYAASAGSTLNVSYSGAKPIYYRGAALVNGIIKAGDTWTFYYDGSHYNAIRASKTYTSGATVRVAYDGQSYWTETSVMAQLAVKNSINTDNLYIGAFSRIHETLDAIDNLVLTIDGNALQVNCGITSTGIVTADSIDVETIGKYYFGDAYLRFDSSSGHLYFYKGSGTEIQIA